jgi:hypothetical protein
MAKSSLCPNWWVKSSKFLPVTIKKSMLTVPGCYTVGVGNAVSIFRVLNNHMVWQSKNGIHIHNQWLWELRISKVTALIDKWNSLCSISRLCVIKWLIFLICRPFTFYNIHILWEKQNYTLTVYNMYLVWRTLYRVIHMTISDSSELLGSSSCCEYDTYLLHK